MAHLLMGHTRLSHGFLMARTEPTICSLCPNEKISTEHLLLTCPIFAVHRTSLEEPTKLESFLADAETKVKKTLSNLFEMKLLFIVCKIQNR